MNVMFSAPVCATVSPDRVRAEMMKVLREAKDRFTDETLQEQSGVDARAIKSYRIEGKEPSLSRALSILSAMGQTDLNRVLATIGYVARPLDESDELQCGEVVACILQHGSVIAKAAADGRIDHIEEPGCQRAADEIIETVLPMSSVGQAA